MIDINPQKLRRHNLAEFRTEFLKNQDDAAVSWFTGIPDDMFRHRVEQVAGESWQSLARKWEAAGWGTDARFSDRMFARVLLRALGELYPDNAVEKVLDEAGQFVMFARAALGHGTASSNLPGRPLSWAEVQKFGAGQPDHNSTWGGSRGLALRLVTLCQVSDGGFSWELLDGSSAPQNPAEHK